MTRVFLPEVQVVDVLEGDGSVRNDSLLGLEYFDAAGCDDALVGCLDEYGGLYKLFFETYQGN
jgi:hypothetical protein